MNTPYPQKKVALKKSLSEGNLSRKASAEGHDTPDSKSQRIRRMSKSVDSLKLMIPKEGLTLSSTTVTHHSDWAEISSSTASLENTSNIHGDGDSIGRKPF